MTQFLSAIEELFQSIYHFFASIVGAVVHAAGAVVGAFLNFFSGIINLFADVFKGAIDVVGGVGSFLLSNVLVIGVLVTGYILYTRQQQGKPVVPNKKTN